MTFPLLEIPPDKQPGAISAILGLSVGAFALSWCLTLLMKHLSPRMGFVDKPGGRKIHANPKPLGGGVAIFLGFALPLLAVVVTLNSITIAQIPGDLKSAYLSGVVKHTPLALCLLGALLAMHVLGLVD